MDRGVRVLHYTPHDEDCGIGEYQRQFLEAMQASDEAYNEIFPYSPNKTKNMSPDEFSKVLGELRDAMKTFDILHLQHELSFYKQGELNRIVSTIKDMGKKMVMTVHTAPAAQYRTPQRRGISPKSFLNYARDIKIARHFTRVHIEAMRGADLILVHNTMTKDNLVEHGIPAANITVIQHPVPMADFTLQSREVRDALSHKEGDVIFACVGFLSRMKGIDHAIRALSYLPDNYKLAIVGGVHPSGVSDALLDELSDMIVRLKLIDRVYITGFVEDDTRLHALIRESDVCVFPYDREYYSYVTSGALFQAIANHKTVLAYPTKPFIEMNKDHTIAITKSANYYELARYLAVLDREGYEQKAKAYAAKHSYAAEAKNLIKIYANLGTNS